MSRVDKPKNNTRLLLFGLCVLVTCSIGYGQVKFVNVQPQIGADFQLYPNSVAGGDIDNDGDVDFFMSVGSTMGNDLMINDLNGSGKFIRADTTMAHFVRTGGPRAVLMADIDNDGDTDLLAIGQDYQIWLIQNKLAETDSLWFEDISEETGIAHQGEPYHGASMADFDNDGKLDLLITGLSLENYNPTLLFKNTTTDGGRVSFEEVADAAGIFSLLGMNMRTGIWGDYDDDGDQDLFITTANKYPVFLYRNEGDGTFADVSEDVGLGDSIGKCRSAVWGDFDNDGDLDIFIGRTIGAEIPDMDICQLFRNDRGVFTEIVSSRMSGLSAPAIAAGDYDNDGDLDFHVLDDASADYLLRNDGAMTFVNVAGDVGLTKTPSPGGWGMMDINDRGGQIWADWDADGDLDLLLSAGNGTRPYLMRNDGGNANNWLRVKLTGVQSNRAAAGARVLAVTSDLKQMREVCIGTGYVTGPPTDVHFGFGVRTTIDSLIIRWPSGTFDVMLNVAVNHILTIREGQTISAVRQKITGTPETYSLTQNYPNPFNPATQISYELAMPASVQLDVFSTSGQLVARLVDEHQAAGSHSIRFDAAHLASGVYVYRMSVNGAVQQKKMLLVK